MAEQAFVASTPLPPHGTFVSTHCSSLCDKRFRVSPKLLERRKSVTARKSVIRAEISITDTILWALENEFKGQDISRVSKSFKGIMEGKSLEVDKGTRRHQRAASYVEGLESVPFYEDLDTDFKWVRHLEKNWDVIAKELRQVTGQEDIKEKGNNIWAPPVVQAANAYGPDWRTLVLQDRVWDPVNTKLFPKTTSILQDINVPCVEAFFARQSADTGIKLHTDDCNFILTMHLGLSTPHQLSWIEVAGERRYWEEGRGLVFNTSYFHQTMNESKDQDRIVLLIRFWHPQLNQVERKALGFLFEVVDQPDTHPAMLKASRELRSKTSGGRTMRQRSGGRGFGS